MTFCQLYPSLFNVFFISCVSVHILALSFKVLRLLAICCLINKDVTIKAIHKISLALRALPIILIGQLSQLWSACSYFYQWGSMQHNPNSVSTAELNYYIIILGLFWECTHPRALAYTSQIPMKYSTMSLFPDIYMILYQKLKLDLIERDLFIVIVLPRVQ